MCTRVAAAFGARTVTSVNLRKPRHSRYGGRADDVVQANRRVRDAAVALRDAATISAQVDARDALREVLCGDGVVECLSAQLVTYLMAMDQLGMLNIDGLSLRDSTHEREKEALELLRQRYQRMVAGDALDQLDRVRAADGEAPATHTGLDPVAGTGPVGLHHLFPEARESVESAQWLHDNVIAVPRGAVLDPSEQAGLRTALLNDLVTASRRDTKAVETAGVTTFKGQRLRAGVSAAAMVALSGTALATGVNDLAAIAGGLSVGVVATGGLAVKGIVDVLKDARAHSAHNVDRQLGIESFTRMSTPGAETGASVSAVTNAIRRVNIGRAVGARAHGTDQGVERLPERALD